MQYVLYVASASSLRGHLVSAPVSSNERRVAVLVDCDNTTPAILDYSLGAVAQFGRVVLRHGYGNSTTLTNKWQEALVRLAFTPHLQYQYVAHKNTSDIALALDALEALFDDRADHICVVTSDSDFAYLCRKLRERGATVSIVGETKTPAALRNASDYFFEWSPGECEVQVPAGATKPVATPAGEKRPIAEAVKPAIKRRPRLVVEAVTLLTSGTPDGKIALGPLGQYLKRSDPDFSPALHGYSGLLDMLKAYDLLTLKKEDGGHYTVRLAQPAAEGLDGPMRKAA
jgi:uncharacterized protein (TIGR00288 family)